MVGMDQAWLLPAVMVAAFVALALFHNYLPRQGDFIAVGASVLAFLGFLFVAGDLFGQLPAAGAELVNNTKGFDWLKIEEIDFTLRIGFLVDQITLVMLAVVSFVGMLIMIYSIGYMRGEKRYGWFFAVMSLFIAAMLTLVLADNFLLLYITWEGVGICSFFLIGFYFDRRSAAEAAKKAFVTTRFGDVFLLIGILMLWLKADTFDMSEIFKMATEGGFDQTYLTAAVLFLFGGAAGKSAQFPFHVWLPDAMEGPTPVSALIHAATMVVAGVYLVARVMPLFEAAHGVALDVVLVLGLITTFMALFMGLVATDIKRVVAYSTLNSLGLMMVALGFGEAGVGPAMLYLFAHAFFKACLFLGCGSVIHATEKQDVAELGGLGAKMPITSRTFLVATLAMAGLAPLSGFFAKDEILVVAESQSYLVLILLLATLPITAMYMLRLYLLTFTGEPRDQHAYEHAHESPRVMSWPLVALASLAVVAGFVVFNGVGEAVGIGSGFLGTVENVLVAEAHAFHFDWALAVISTLLVGGGLAVGYRAWTGDRELAHQTALTFPFFYGLFRNRFYVDDFYQWCINNLVLGLAKIVAVFDRVVVNDTGVNGPGQVTGAFGFLLKFQQTGRLPNYALAMILGVTVIAIVGLAVKG